MATSRRHIIIAVSVVLIILAASSAWWFDSYFLRVTAKNEAPLVEQKEGAGTSFIMPTFQDNTIAARIFYPADNKILFEQKSVPSDPLPVKMAETLITEYLKRLNGDLKTTKLLGVYKDRENILYIDLSDSFMKNFNGGAEQEYNLLKSLYDTVASNVPGTTDIKLLIEGKEIESIGGHFYSLYPLRGTFDDVRQVPAAATPDQATDR